MNGLFSPDMFANQAVVNALLTGTVVAAATAVLGFFVVLRGLSFAGHAVTDIGFTGGAAAVLLGLPQLWGLLAFCLLAALAIGVLGDRARERDVATGVILALCIGLGALCLYAGTQGAAGTHNANAPFVLLFGSIFTIDPTLIAPMVAIAVACVLAVAILYRPLLFSSVAPEVAQARGVPVRLIGLIFLVVMALVVAETAQVMGVLLSTALLIGPPATAAYLTANTGRAIAIAAVLGVVETWLGIILSYDSYYWAAR
jgi:zinc/manganese transport system permease protein